MVDFTPLTMRALSPRDLADGRSKVYYILAGARVCQLPLRNGGIYRGRGVSSPDDTRARLCKTRVSSHYIDMQATRI